MTRRNIEIDTLRGIACILLVGYHVVGNGPHNGLQLGDGLVREFNELLGHLRLPLFTFLSGYVYAMRPLQGDVGRFLQGKTRRLLLPMLCVGTLFALSRTLTPGANSGEPDNWLLFYLRPDTHFWFLEALFVIFLLLIPLERLGALEKRRTALVVFAAAAGLNLMNIEIAWFALGGAIYLLPFFILGAHCCRFAELEQRPLDRAWLVFLGCAALMVLVFNLPGDKHTLHSLLFSGLGCLVLLISRMRLRWLAWIGVFSYTIYLFHVFFTAGARIVLTKVGWDHLLLLGVAGLAAGLLGPIVVDKTLDRFQLGRMLFLGRRAAAPA